MAQHIHPVDIPPRFYKPIGQIIAGWNLTEALVSSIIWHFHKIEDPKIGRLFTYRLNAEDKLRIFKETAERYAPEPSVKATMLGLHRDADKLRIKRNRFAHGLWGHLPQESTTWKIFYLNSTKDTHLLKREVVKLQELNDLAVRVWTLNRSLEKLMLHIGAPPP
jgi:hypothetical protein